MWRTAFGVGRGATAGPARGQMLLSHTLLDIVRPGVAARVTNTVSSTSSSTSSGTSTRPSSSSSSRGARSRPTTRAPKIFEERANTTPDRSRSRAANTGGGSSSSSSSSSSPGRRFTPSQQSGSSSTYSRTSRTSRAEPESQPPRPRARDILLKRKSEAPEELSQPAIDFSSGSRDDPTFVPRDPKVQDGPWSDIDKRLVIAAQRDAEQQAQLGPLQHPSSTSQPPPSSSTHTSSSTPPADLQGFVLLGKTLEQLTALVQQLGQPSYRAKQIQDSLLRGCRSVSELAVLPKGFKEQLSAAGVVTGRSVVHRSVAAPDGTRKLLLQLQEGRVVEAVGIPVTDEGGKQRLTVCVSSQVGCPMRCTFCATGKGGFARNLQAHEIIDQVLTVGEVFQQRPTNVVFMGMGEPLLNIPAVVAAATYMREQMGMSGRSLTISTVGVPHAIRKLAQHKLTATLAVSIHAPTQELREVLIPSAKVYPLQTLMSDCSAYFKATGRRVTFEYTLMGGTNDSTEHAQELAALLRRHNLSSHVNLIPWNPVDDSPYKRPGRGVVASFKQVLEDAGLPVSVRTTRGLEAAAACGQLRNQFQKMQLRDPRPLS